MEMTRKSKKNIKEEPAEGVPKRRTRTRSRTQKTPPASSVLATVANHGERVTRPGRNKRKRQSDMLIFNNGGGSVTFLRESGRTADWDDYLKDLKAVQWLSPVDYFPEAPLAKHWKDLTTAKVGSKIELPHPRTIGSIPVYCVATIIGFAGYKALVKFENVRNGGGHYSAWVSFFSDIPKPLGYAISNNYLVLPVEVTADGAPNIDRATHIQFIEQIYTDEVFASMKMADDTTEKLLRQELKTFYENSKYKLNDVIEVMDKADPVRNRLAVVVCIVGNRIQVKYLGVSSNDEGFCFNMNSELIHPLGWSHAVGQSLYGDVNNAFQFPSLSKKCFSIVPSDVVIQCGMVFEVRHPFYPYKIVAGTVKKKLKHGYFVALIETTNPQDYAEFVFHVTSQYVLPCGFSAKYNITLEVPPGEDSYSFTWKGYFEKRKVKPLIVKTRYQARKHQFFKGCKFEAVDVFEPMYLGPATVLNVAEHLLYIHFDGWPRTQMESYQWISAFSGDIYPAGWAEMVGHRLQGHAEPPNSCDAFYLVTHSDLDASGISIAV